MPRHTHAGDDRPVFALVRAEFLVPGCRSLKEKRKVLRSLIEKARHKFACALAETGHQDLHQRAQVGAAFVSGDSGHAAEQADALVRWMSLHPEARLVDHEVEIV